MPTWFMSYAQRTSGRGVEFGCFLCLQDEHPITVIVDWNRESQWDREKHPEEPEVVYVLLFYREIGPGEQASLSGLDEIEANFSTGP